MSVPGEVPVLRVPDMDGWEYQVVEGGAVAFAVHAPGSEVVGALGLVQVVDGDLAVLLSEALAGEGAPDDLRRQPVERRQRGRRSGGVLGTRLVPGQQDDVGATVVQDFVGYAELPRRGGLARLDLTVVDALLFEDLAEFCLDLLGAVELGRRAA